MTVLQKGDRGNDVTILQGYLHLVQDGIFGSITQEAVKAFQREHNLIADGIVGVNTWRLLESKGKPEAVKTTTTTIGTCVIKKSSRVINMIICHCTATPEGKDYTVDQIRNAHKANGWSDIGYHYVIYRDGTIHNGRDVNKIGAHTANYNAHSIGVSYVGGVDAKNKPKDTRTQAQKASFIKLLNQLRKLYPNAKIYGHRNFTNLKACPSFDAKKEYENI